MNKKFLAKKVWIRITNPFRPTLKGAICGHKTKRAGEITVHDKSCVMEMPVNDDGHPDYCLSCIADMAIRCAWCGGTLPVLRNSPSRMRQEKTMSSQSLGCNSHRVVRR